jgi:hypothetical protein
MKYNKKMQKTNLKKFLLVSNNYKSNKNLEKIDKIKDIIQELNYSLGENIIDKIMKTHKDYEFGVKFLKFLEFHRKLNPKDITKKLNIENQRLIESWYRGYPPRPIRTLLRIYFNRYHKINKEILANLFGWGFGDGGLQFDLGYYFICGKKDDLLSIKKYLSFSIPEIYSVIKKNDGNNLITLHDGTKKLIKGKSWILYINESPFCKLLYSQRLPKGNKVLQKVNIPNWIKKGDKKIKKAFLNSLFEGEMQTHKVKYNEKRNKMDIISVSFGMNKVEDYIENLTDFLNEIRDLLHEFNIKTSKVENFKPGTIRKDGKKTYFTRFHISNSALNTIHFSKLIDYPFNNEKNNALLTAIEEARVKIRRMNNQVTKYKKALELHKQGLSINKISKELDIQWHTANNWINTREHLPVLLNQDIGDIHA